MVKHLYLFYSAVISIILILGLVAILKKNKDYFKRVKGLKRGSDKKAKGIIFGKIGIFQRVLYSPTDNEGHACVFGGSGSGKTVWLINTLRNWTGTSFVIDISGDISSNVPCDKKLVYDPLEPSTIPFNIFGAIDELQTEAEKNEALEQLAYQLMPDQVNISDSGRFFLNEGRKFLIASLIAFYHEGADFIPICERLVSANYLTVINQIKATKNKQAIKYIAGFEGANEQNTAGCYQSCVSSIHLFGTNQTVQKTIHRPINNEICFTAKTLNKYNVYVLIPDEKLETLAPLLHIITAQILNFLSARSNNEKNTILLCLDEFASLGKLDILPALRKLRKKKIRILVLTQSLADLDLIYGKNERTAMLNNCNFKIVLSASDVDTQEYFSKLAGTHKVKKETINQNNSFGVTNSTSITYIDEANIKPTEFAALDKKLVLLYAGKHYKLKKIYYFKKRGYKKND